MQQAIDFVMEIDKLKRVTRKTKPLGLDRYENSAEHSWQIALFANALAPYCDDPVNLSRVVQMLLVHDLGEIDTGDTLVFADIDWAAEKSAEKAAVERIMGYLPPEIAGPLIDLWIEFEANESGDARFANAIDRAMPALLNLNNEGQSWRENGISYSQVVKRIKGPIRGGCPRLWEYMEPRLAKADEQGWFGA
ncbi:HD domain-containing protein [Stakelama sp. CBK3Z-3]|uniref:HD domain-containing protein n=1 Tax=Stakelama flava TaxID=2860338 RepID=A0ABS6XL49_9SPHN|nr:HD domain-containing protein [Stakelama flava]MBW4330933.1 HD domain-containing protein [Stakelama flava]